MKSKILILFLCIIAFSCERQNDNMTPFAQEATYHYDGSGIICDFYPMQTRSNEEGTETYLMTSAEYNGENAFTSIVSSSSIGSKHFVLEQYTQDREYIGTIVIHGNKIVQVNYNDDVFIAPIIPEANRKLLQCIGEKYKRLGEIINSDGEAQILCDGLNTSQLCNLAKVTAAAYICMRNK